jgi:hypothetical protein
MFPAALPNLAGLLMGQRLLFRAVMWLCVSVSCATESQCMTLPLNIYHSGLPVLVVCFPQVRQTDVFYISTYVEVHDLTTRPIVKKIYTQ